MCCVWIQSHALMRRRTKVMISDAGYDSIDQVLAAGHSGMRMGLKTGFASSLDRSVVVDS
jgi:hypothetical protein